MGLIVGAVIGIQSLLKKKSKNPTPDISPPNVASQGAFIPLQIGRRRIGAVIGWAGSRYARLEETVSSGGFGKGSKKKKGGQTIFYEAAWHQVCVGPAAILHQIWQDGKPLWTGPINSVDDPSGSSFIALDGSSFTIYWGEPNQPVDAILADAGRVGVASRWPHLCYVVWTNKRLGSSPRWPQIEYDIECKAYTEQLDVDYPGLTTAVVPYITAAGYAGVNAGYAMGQVLFESYPHGIGLDSSKYSIFAGAVDPCSDDASTVTGDVGDYISPVGATTDANSLTSGIESLTWSATYTIVDEGWYEVWGSTVLGCGDAVAGSGGGNPVGQPILITLTKGAEVIVLMDETIPDVPLNDTLDCWSLFYAAGTARYTSALRRTFLYLTAGVWTLDGSLDVDLAPGTSVGKFDVDCTFDLQELENPVVVGAGTGSFLDLVTTMDTDEQVASLTAEGGPDAESIVDSSMLDMGVMLHRDYDNLGLNSWTVIREATATALPDEMILPTETLSEASYGDRDISKVMYSFDDVERQYRKSVLSVDGDGSASLVNNVKAQEVSLDTIIDFDVASFVAERRSQEVVDPAKFTIFAGRRARAFPPGMLISVTDVPTALRITDVKINPDDDKVEIACVADYYGAELSTKIHVQTPTSAGDTTPTADNLQADFFEVPAFLGTPGVMEITPLRIRATQSESQQVIHLSQDNVTYTEAVRDIFVMSGGVLTEGMLATGWEFENGPTFDTEGLDIADVVEDYSADEFSWRLGRQLCVIGDELFYLRNVTALGGSSYRLNGLIRARYDTERAAHSVSDPVFIFQADGVGPFYDVILAPSQVVYMKQQAVGSNGAVALGSVAVASRTLVGKGIVPMRVGALRPTAPALGVFAFSTGEDISFDWNYRSTATPNTGAGLQGAGYVTGTSAVQGTFEIRLLTLSNVLKQTITQATTGYTLTNANLVSWFSGEESVRVQVRNIIGGFRSTVIERDFLLV